MEGSDGSLSLALVRPPPEFWAPQNRRDIDKVERVQWRTTEMIRRLEHMMYKERLRDEFVSSQEEKDNVMGGILLLPMII